MLCESNTFCEYANGSVINTVHVQFVAALFGLPLKEHGSKTQVLTEKHLYDLLSTIFCQMCLDKDEVAGFSLKEKATEANETLTKLVRSNVAAVSRGRIVKPWVDNIKADGNLDSYSNSLIKKSLKAGNSIDEITKEIIPTAAAAFANQIQQVPLQVSLLISLLKCSTYICLKNTLIIGLRLSNWLKLGPASPLGN
jgi:hypothetical protein